MSRKNGKYPMTFFVLQTPSTAVNKDVMQFKIVDLVVINYILRSVIYDNFATIRPRDLGPADIRVHEHSGRAGGGEGVHHPLLSPRGIAKCFDWIRFRPP